MDRAIGFAIGIIGLREFLLEVLHRGVRAGFRFGLQESLGSVADGKDGKDAGLILCCKGKLPLLPFCRAVDETALFVLHIAIRCIRADCGLEGRKVERHILRLAWGIDLPESLDAFCKALADGAFLIIREVDGISRLIGGNGSISRALALDTEDVLGVFPVIAVKLGRWHEIGILPVFWWIGRREAVKDALTLLEENDIIVHITVEIRESTRKGAVARGFGRQVECADEVSVPTDFLMLVFVHILQERPIHESNDKAIGTDALDELLELIDLLGGIFPSVECLDVLELAVASLVIRDAPNRKVEGVLGKFCALEVLLALGKVWMQG